MKWNKKQGFIATLAYAELFEYPLTSEELHRWHITNTSTVSSGLPSFLKLSLKGDYVMFSSHKTYSQKREHRGQISKKKWIIAKKNASILQIIPTVQLIGVSGGLSMNNTDKDDDIDFFIVVTPKTLWISRLLVLLILEIVGARRKFGDIQTTDKICPNMFVDANHLCLPMNEQNLYSAHEVLQMIPLIDKNNTYEHFLEQNSWVKRYLYNAWEEKVEGSKLKVQSYKKNVLQSVTFHFALFTLHLLEIPAKHLQLWYMKNHKTTEIISDTVLRFHPRDIKVFVRQNYLKLLSKYKIPLDSRFLDSLQ